MILLTKELREGMPALYATEEVPLGEKVVVVKFFTPWSAWTWYAVEGQDEEDDYTFFGLVDGLELEWGYFVLSELQELKGPAGLRVERDLHFGLPKIKDIAALKGRITLG